MIYGSVDPGQNGAVCFMNENGEIEIFDTPSYMPEKKDKKDYDIKKMAEILLKYKENKVIFVIEAVHAMIGNGGVSSFNFGRGKGLWEGIAFACGFNVHMVSPQTWKKHFPDLISTVKPDKTKSKSEQAKDKRIKKSLAKTKARELASSLCPQFADKFAKVKDDGRAEAFLLMTYIKEQHIKGNITI